MLQPKPQRQPIPKPPVRIIREPVVHHGQTFNHTELAGHDFYMPEQTAEVIEGHVITTSPERLGVSTDGNGGRELPPTILELSRDVSIEFTDTNKDYRPGLARQGFDNPSYPLYNATLHYGRTSLDLTRGTGASKKPVFFTGTEGNFLACDPRMNGDDRDYMIVGVDHEELLETPGKLSAVWHELGHIAIFDREYDVDAAYTAQSFRTDLKPNLEDIDLYIDELKRSIPDSERWVQNTTDLWTRLMRPSLPIDVEKAVFLLHEHKAWMIGKHLKDSLGAPDGFKDRGSFGKYAYACLATYARYYKDERFHRGIKHRK